MNFQLEVKDGKFNFDKALKNLNGDHQVLTDAIQRFAKLQSHLSAKNCSHNITLGAK